MEKVDLIGKSTAGLHEFRGNIWAGNGRISMGGQDERRARKSRKWTGQCHMTLAIVVGGHVCQDPDVTHVTRSR